MNETERKASKDPGDAALWLGRLGREKKAHQKFRDRAKTAIAAAQSKQGDSEDKGKRGDPIWWSNSKITIGAVFSRQPKPDVRRRIIDSKTDKNLALAVERGITYQQDTTTFADHSNRSVWEFLVCGLGVTRLYLEDEEGERPALNPIDQSVLIDPETQQPLMEKYIESRKIGLDYTPWDLFFWEPCKTWDDCGWEGFGRWMPAWEINEEFDVKIGREGGGPGSDSGIGAVKKPDANKYEPLLLVVEIHDKRKREVVTVCEGYPKVLKREADKLKLKDFFPNARPMMLNLQSGDLTPCPEYFYIQGKCEEIDRLTERCRGLIKSIKDVGFYDASFALELSSYMEQSDGARIPVPNLMAKMEQASMKGLFVTEDIRSKVEALVQWVAEKDRAKDDLYQTTGIGDIIRTASKASETATAQEIKERWANVRLFEKMREISYHFRDTFRIMGELIAEHFSPEQLSAQSGIEITPEMAQILKSDLSRCYAIDIEADSTIAQDEQQDKTERNEFITAVTNSLGTLSPMVQQGFLTADVMNQMLLFVVRGYKHGRTLEEAFEKLPDTMAQLQQLQGQVQQGQQAQEQSAAQMQQMQAMAAQQAQEAQKAMEQLQQEAERVIADQQTQLDQMAAKLAQAEQQISMAKQLEAMGKARDLDAAANLKDAQAQKLALDTAAGLFSGGAPDDGTMQ